jgi:hypothetical protein
MTFTPFTQHLPPPSYWSACKAAPKIKAWAEDHGIVAPNRGIRLSAMAGILVVGP